mgnify:CR=1 FL=1
MNVGQLQHHHQKIELISPQLSQRLPRQGGLRNQLMTVQTLQGRTELTSNRTNECNTGHEIPQYIRPPKASPDPLAMLQRPSLLLF